MTLTDPWPWYVAGPLIGLMVPALLLIGNKGFGLSANFDHLCSACLPARGPKRWYAETWNLLIIAGMLLGGFLGGVVLKNPAPPQVSASAQRSLQDLGVNVTPDLIPAQMYDLSNPKVWLLLAASGLLVGFGTRYGRGCTSGHAILGLSTLQWRSLVGTVSFFAAGILSAQFLLPWFLR